MTLVVDASVVVAALVDSGSDGLWAESELLSGALAAPHLLPAEVANILRRAVRPKAIPAGLGAIANRTCFNCVLRSCPMRRWDLGFGSCAGLSQLTMPGMWRWRSDSLLRCLRWIGS